MQEPDLSKSMLKMSYHDNSRLELVRRLAMEMGITYESPKKMDETLIIKREDYTKSYEVLKRVRLREPAIEKLFLIYVKKCEISRK